MPFEWNPQVNLFGFTPKEPVNRFLDLIEIVCGDAWLYAQSPYAGLWFVDSALTPRSMLAVMEKHVPPTRPGFRSFRIDRATIGEHIRFSLLNNDSWYATFRSTQLVTALTPRDRSEAMVSQVDIEIKERP